MGEVVNGRPRTSERNTEPMPLRQIKSNNAEDDDDSPTAVLTKDSRDEEEDDSSSDMSVGDDPYIYSDDSASLSDAYFHPQSDDELAKSPRYRTPGEGDSLTAFGQQQHPSASYYGALAQSAERAVSPLWVSGSIQEDSESAPAFGPDEALMPGHALKYQLGPTAGGKERRKRKHRQDRRMQRKQQEQLNRERAVTKVRGTPQEDASRKDSLFAVLFVVQLIVVTLCAFRFGFGVIRFRKEDTLDWSHYIKGRKDHFNWQSNTPASTERGATELMQNASINALEYTDDLHGATPHNTSSTTDDYVHQTSATTATGVNPDDSFTIDSQNVFALVGISGLYACVLSYITFGFMLILARSLIQIVLIFSVALALACGVIGLVLDPYGAISILAFTALLTTLGYTMFNWNRIPFAATNLHTALCAMRCTADITILGLVSLVVAFSWSLIWTMAFVGVVNSFNTVDCDEKDQCRPHLLKSHIPLYLLLLLSFHWTNMVIKNVVKTSVASCIATWWFRPSEISPFCSSAVVRPLLRALTKSLGSICKGSLLLQPAQALSLVGRFCCCLFGGSDSSSCMNPQERSRGVALAPPRQKVEADESAADSVGLCQRPCCGLFDQCGFHLRCYNRWAYAYVGMYGYNFCEAGERAYQLFATREWLEVVKDNLIKNTLLIASIVIGGSTGTFAVVAEEMDGYDFTSFHRPAMPAFIVGSVLGYVLSNTLMLGVVGSAVNTVLVCFAAGPFEFDQNHPRLSREMREAWTQQVWEPPV